MKQKIPFFISCFLLLPLLFSGCGDAGAGLTEENYPSVSGCEVTSVLMRNAKASVLKTEPGSLTSDTSFLTNDGAYGALASGEKSLIFTTEEPSAERNAALRESGDSFLMEKIAVDALVFYTPSSNPVKSLTSQELSDIFSGNITDWRSLSGDHVTVIPHLLPDDSFCHTLLKSFLLDGKEPTIQISSFSLPDGQDPLTLSLGSVQSEAADTDLPEEGSLSYGSYFFLSSLDDNMNIRLLAVSGVSPSQETLSNGKYPFTYPIYAVIRSSEAEGSPARLLLKYLQSKDGQKMIREASYGTIS